MFLSRGADWGTEATVDKYGLCIHYDTGTQYLNFIDWANTTMFTDDGTSVYTDGGGKKTTMEFVTQGSGYVILVKAKSDGTALEGKYLRHETSDKGEHVVITDDVNQATVWTLKTKAEHDAILATYTNDNVTSVIAKANMTATVEDFATVIENKDNYRSVDVSSKINNTGFTWTIFSERNWGNYKSSNDPNAVEVFKQTGIWSQSVTGLDKGLYKVTFHGLDRYGTYGDVTTQGNNGYENVTSFVRANDEDVLMPSWYSEHTGTSYPDKVSEAQAAFKEGKYEKSFYTYVADDCKLDITVNIPSYKDFSWVIFNNWSLTYYTDQMSTEDANAIIAEAQEAQQKPMEASVLETLTTALEQFQSANTIAAYNTLNEALTAAKASVKAYADAPEKLVAMQKIVVENTFVTKAAKESYQNLYDTNKAKYDAHTLTTAEATSLENPYTVTDYQVNNTVDDYLISSWNVQPMTWKDYHVNTWSVEGNSDGTDFKVPFIQYWVSDANVLGAKTMTATMTATDGIEANALYKVSAWVRARQTNNKTWDLSKITANVGNGTAVQMDATEQTVGVYALKHITVYGYADAEANLTFNLNVADGSNVSWLAWQQVCAEKAEPTLLDETSKEDIVPVETAPVLLKRTFLAGSWNTLVLPFNLSMEQIKKAFGEDTKVVAFSDDAADASLVHFKDAEEIKANVPVLIKVSTSDSEFTFNDVTVNVDTPVANGENGNWNFVGTYQAGTKVPENAYELYSNKWYLSRGTDKYVINGFRSYIAPASATASAKGLTVVVGDNATAIDNIVSEVTEDGTVYNIAGQRVGSNQKGIVIKNGKTVLVK